MGTAYAYVLIFIYVSTAFVYARFSVVRNVTPRKPYVRDATSCGGWNFNVFLYLRNPGSQRCTDYVCQMKTIPSEKVPIVFFFLICG